MRRIKVICRDGIGCNTEIIDIETGENLCQKYDIRAISVSIDVDNIATANIEFFRPEIEIISEEVETNKQILKGAL
jgi:hypothetical protein